MDRQKLRRALLLPFAAWFLFFVLGPVLLLVLTSFSHRTDLGGVEKALSLEAYGALVQPVYARVLFSTLLFALANTLLTLLAAFPVALLMSRVSPSLKSGLMALVLIPFWTSYLVRILAFMGWLRSDGVRALALLYTPPGVVLGLVYNYLPFAILPLYAALERIEKRTLEAAEDLGASRRQILWNVILPMCRGGLLSAAIFVFVPSLGEYLIPELIGGGRSYLVGSFLQNQFMGARNWPLGSAAIVFLVAVTLIMVLMMPGEDQDTPLGKGL